MVWYGMVWHGMLWYGMVWYTMALGLGWDEMGLVWYGMPWHTMARHGTVWHGMVWHGMERTHMVLDDIADDSKAIKVAAATGSRGGRGVGCAV